MGQMPCKIWRKLHAAEAKILDEAYALRVRYPALNIEQARNLVVSRGDPVAYLARFEARQKRAASPKGQAMQARRSLNNQPIEAWLANTVKDHLQAVVLFERQSTMAVIEAVRRFTYNLQGQGEVKKTEVVAIGPVTAWRAHAAALELDPALTEAPAAVAPRPDARPFFDPRPFAPMVGKAIRLQLRNGVALTGVLSAVGGFDLMLGTPSEPLLIPLHALVSWKALEPESAPASPSPSSSPSPASPPASS
jgi:hypothetical protein